MKPVSCYKRTGRLRATASTLIRARRELKIVLLGILMVTALAVLNANAIAHSTAPSPAFMRLAQQPSSPTFRAAQAAFLPTPQPSLFTRTGDASIQIHELAAYVQANDLPTRTVQTDLAQHPKVSQFYDIDSSPAGFGQNACGLVAAAAALGGPDWIPLVSQIAQAAGANYHPDTGIQPSKFVLALQSVFGIQNVAAMNDATLGELYQSLRAGEVVIVDLKVSPTRNAPSADPPNYAHFARVLGLDVAAQQVYVENTLNGPSYWTLSLTDFLQAWEQPETSSSLIPAPQTAEPVTHWLVRLDSSAAVG